MSSPLLVRSFLSLVEIDFKSSFTRDATESIPISKRLKEKNNHGYNFLQSLIIFGFEAFFPNAQKMKFSIMDFFSKCDQVCSFLWIWSHFLKKSLMENFIFCAVSVIGHDEKFHVFSDTVYITIFRICPLTSLHQFT